MLKKSDKQTIRNHSLPQALQGYLAGHFISVGSVTAWHLARVWFLLRTDNAVSSAGDIIDSHNNFHQQGGMKRF